MNELNLAISVAEQVRAAGGRAFFVGGYVRDRLMNLPGKDIDIEVYGIPPTKLREALSQLGEVYDKGAAFGVLGLRHSDLDIAMPRKESRTGEKHTDFDVSVDPFLSYEEASRRRDFTINAMMLDPLTDEIVDCWGGQEDLKKPVIRHVSDETFADDALRVFRGAQFSARLNAEIAPETMALCTKMNVTFLSHERVYEELSKALLKADRPSIFFRRLREMGHLDEYFPEIRNLIGVEQNPAYHPEGDVFEHTLLVLDKAAALREQAKEPLNFMLAALLHDLGKYDASEIIDGRITSHLHPDTGVPLAETQLRRLTNNARTINYVKNMVRLHMRPNMLAVSHSKKRKTRVLFDESLCPEDLILLSRADAEGSLGTPYNTDSWDFLHERLADYRDCLTRPMVTGADLLQAGWQSGPRMKDLMQRARLLHFSGMEKKRVLQMLLKEMPPEKG